MSIHDTVAAAVEYGDNRDFSGCIQVRVPVVLVNNGPRPIESVSVLHKHLGLTSMTQTLKWTKVARNAETQPIYVDTFVGNGLSCMRSDYWQLLWEYSPDDQGKCKYCKIVNKTVDVDENGEPIRRDACETHMSVSIL